LNLVKRIFFGLFILGACLALMWGYIYLKNSKKPKVEALSILPDGCSMCISSANFLEVIKKINSQNLIIDNFKEEKVIGRFLSTLQLVDSIIINTNNLIEKLKNTPIHLAVYNTPKDWLCVFNIKQLGDEAAILEEVNTTFNAHKLENNLYEFKTSTNVSFLYTLKFGVFIISNSSNLINNALTKNLPKLVNNKDFKPYNSNLIESNSLSIYLNHNVFETNKTKSDFNLNLITKTAISSGKIDIEPNQIKINGFCNIDTNDLMSNLYNQQAQHLNFTEDLPFNTIEFTAYGFNTLQQLNKNNNALLFWEKINDTALYNLKSAFYENINHQLINFKLKFNNQAYCLIPVTDSVKTFEQLSFMCDSAKQIVKQQIYHLAQTKNKLQIVYPFFNTPTNYVFYYNSKLYFGDTKQALQQLLESITTNSTLNSNKSFVNYKNQNLSESYNYCYYSAINNNNDAVSNFYKLNANYCKNLKHFSYTLSNNKTNFKFRCNLLHETNQVNYEQNSLWSLQLDTTIQQQPYSFISHITNENEIVIQDDANGLYLVNAKGNIVWKKKINEAIQSKIYTVDIFKNNKLQLLFNSKNYIHLIDRNGNYVQGYPVKLPSEATSPLSLFDYESNKNYRLFIACKNKNIYNYTIYGIKQLGFNPIVTESEVNLPLHYAKVGLSDYLVAIDKLGKIYTFSRKGEGRIGLKNKTIQNCSAFYVDASNSTNSTYLVYVDDKNNLLNKISFTDKKEIKKINAPILEATVTYKLIDDNRTVDVLITTPNQVLACDFNGNIIFEKNLEKELTLSDFYSDETNSDLFSFSSSLKQLFITDINQQKTKTINASGLPLISNLFNDKKKYIIYSYNATLNCTAL
jgi:hypothetical protein